MTAIFTGCAALICLSQDEQKPYRYWEGFEVGSWAVVRCSASGPMGERKSVVRCEFTNEGVKRTVVEGIDPRVLPEQMSSFKWIDALPSKNLKKTSLPKKTTTFAGGEVECERAKYSVEYDGKPAVDVDIWRSDAIRAPSYLIATPGTHTAVPANVAKWRIISHPDPARPKAGGYEMRVILREKEFVEVGKQRIECLKADGLFDGVWFEGKRKLTFTIWLSDQVPGHVVRQEGTVEDEDASMKQRFEVVDFHAPKAAKTKRDD